MDTEGQMSCIPPPPAYSEQEFDQKIVHATELSLERNTADNEDDWEEWDEAKFEAAARALSQTSSYTGKTLTSSDIEYGREQASSSSPSSAAGQVQPLNIRKKPRLLKPGKDALGIYSQKSYPPLPITVSKEASEANFHLEENEKFISSPLYYPTGGYSQHNIPQGNYEGKYEPQQTPFHHAVPRFRTEATAQFPPNSYPAPGNTTQRRVRDRYRPPEHHSLASYGSSSSGLSERHDGPRIKFHPSMAYTNSPDVEDLSAGNRSGIHVDATSFYNASVSAHLSTPMEFVSRPPAYPTNTGRSSVLAHQTGGNLTSRTTGHTDFENRLMPTRYIPDVEERSFVSSVQPNMRYSSYPRSEYSA